MISSSSAVALDGPLLLAALSSVAKYIGGGRHAHYRSDSNKGEMGGASELRQSIENAGGRGQTLRYDLWCAVAIAVVVGWLQLAAGDGTVEKKLGGLVYFRHVCLGEPGIAPAVCPLAVQS